LEIFKMSPARHFTGIMTIKNDLNPN
jgi:hypothetical protein